jgi:hypothetical protein
MLAILKNSNQKTMLYPLQKKMITGVKHIIAQQKSGLYL